MKLYLELNHYDTKSLIHGVDYHKGLEDGRRCGRVHEYMTRSCKPIVFTEEELGASLELHPERFVEVIPLRDNLTIESIVCGE